MKKIICYLLLLCLVVCVFSACSKGKNSDNTVTSVQTGVQKDDITDSIPQSSSQSNLSDGDSVITPSKITTGTPSNTETSKDNKPQKIESQSQGGVSSVTESSTPQKPSGEVKMLTYEEYFAKTPAEQQAYYESFDSVEAFAKWYNQAKAEYDAKNEGIPIGPGGSIDLGDLIK